MWITWIRVFQKVKSKKKIKKEKGNKSLRKVDMFFTLQ